MTDLNSGQSWYRPSYLLVMVMKDGRVFEGITAWFENGQLGLRFTTSL